MKEESPVAFRLPSHHKKKKGRENSEERGKETQEIRSQVPVIDVRLLSSF